MGRGRRLKEPLRSLTEEERGYIEQVCRSSSAPASLVSRAKMLRAVAAGATAIDAARAGGCVDGDTVTALIRRVNAEGLAALPPRHSGGSEPRYTPALRQRILQEARRTPTPHEDGTATWSLTLLQNTLRQHDGLETLGRSTIHTILHEEGMTYQKDRSWADTKKVIRKRKAGIVEVTDPHAETKKKY